MFPTLTTTYDGGVFLIAQGTHICLFSFILRGGQVAFIGPSMRRDGVLWSIKRVTDLPPNAKLREVQQNTYGPMQPIRTATPNAVNQTLMPKLSKQMLNVCPRPPMHIFA